MPEKKKEIYVLTKTDDDDDKNYYSSLDEILETFSNEDFPIEFDIYELKQKKVKVDIETKIFVEK